MAYANQFSQYDPNWMKKLLKPGGADANMLGKGLFANRKYGKAIDDLTTGGYNVQWGAGLNPAQGTLGGYKQSSPRPKKVWNFGAPANVGGGGGQPTLNKGSQSMALGNMGGYRAAPGGGSAAHGEVDAVDPRRASTNQAGQWDRYAAAGGSPGRPWSAGASGDSGNAPRMPKGAAPTQLGAEPNDAAMEMMRRIGEMSPEIQDWWGAILNQGIYGQQGMESILAPKENAANQVIQGLDPFLKMMLGISDTQNQSAQDQTRLTGADQRRRTTQGMSDMMSRLGARNPGAAMRTQNEAMMPLYQNQANQAYGANQDRLNQELGLRTDAQNTYQNLITNMGADRSNLTRDNMGSKLTGLQGLSGARMDDAALVGNRFWDTKDPVDKQLDYSTTMADLQHGFGNQDAARDNRFNLERMKYGADLQQFLMQYEKELNEPSAWEKFLGYLSQFGPGGG